MTTTQAVPAYTLSVHELEALVDRAVRKATAQPATPASIPSKEVLTREQAAELLQVNPHSIPRLIKKGMPAHRLGKKEWRFRRSEILDWLATQNGAV